MDVSSDGQDTPLSPFASALDIVDDKLAADAASNSVTDSDADSKWNMSLFNFPIATRNENVGRFPWVGTPSLPWQVVLRVLNNRYPAKPFYPKDPRVSKSIWEVLVIQKNRAASNKIIRNVAAIYARTRRVVDRQHSEADELIEYAD